MSLIYDWFGFRSFLYDRHLPLPSILNFSLHLPPLPPLPLFLPHLPHHTTTCCHCRLPPRLTCTARTRLSSVLLHARTARMPRTHARCTTALHCTHACWAGCWAYLSYKKPLYLVSVRSRPWVGFGLLTVWVQWISSDHLVS